MRRRILRGGDLIPLTPKAFTILLALLEKRGEIVDKEDLLKEVWPDTFVTEANLTQNVSALRKALGERANDRRYVVTVPGRGYSFVGDVREVQRQATGEIALPVVTATTEESQPQAAESAVAFAADERPVDLNGEEESRTTGSNGPGPPVRRFPRWLVPAAVLLALGFVAWLIFASPWRLLSPAGGSPTGEKQAAAAGAALPAVAVLGFKNLSGKEDERWVATALGEMLSTELGASSSARIISSENVARVRRTLPFAYKEDLAGDQVERLHKLLGADLIVLGTYLLSPRTDGGKIRLDLRVLRAPSGELVASFALVGSGGALIDLGAKAGEELRTRLGWAEPSAEAARATAALQPSNDRAAQLYSQGLEMLRSSDAAGARDQLLAAAEADPDFAVVRSLLSQAYTELGSDRAAQREAEAALKLSSALPSEQRLEIQARYRETRKDWDKASEIYRSLWLLHPERLEYGLRLVQSLSIGGRGGEAAAAIDDLRRLPAPQSDDPRIDLAEAQHARRVGNPALEFRTARTAQVKGRNLNQPQVVGEALLLQGDAHYTKGLPEESVRALESARALFEQTGNKAAVARTLNRIGANELYTGRLREAEGHFLEAKAIAEELGSESLVASQIGGLGLTALSKGDLRLALRRCEDSHRRFAAIGDRVYETRMLFFIAHVQALSGETAAAQEKLGRVLSQARSSSNRVEEAQALDGLGNLLVDAGRFAEGRRLQEQAHGLAKSYGDPLLAASYLASLGRTLAYQGDFAAAQQKLAEALAEKRRVQDRVGEAGVLGDLAALALRRGDLPAARGHASRQLELAREIGARLEVVDALRILGGADLASGNPAQARRRMTEALGSATGLAAGREVAELRVDLARVALAEGGAAEALKLARAAADWLRERSIVGWEGRALLALADAALALGRRTEAADAARRAFYLSTSPTDTDRELKLASTMRDALGAAARGSYGEAAGHLSGMLEPAAKSGEIPLWFEGRSIQASLLHSRGDRVAAAAAFQALARDAAARGFFLISRRAEKQAAASLARPLG